MPSNQISYFDTLYDALCFLTERVLKNRHWQCHYYYPRSSLPSIYDIDVSIPDAPPAQQAIAYTIDGAKLLHEMKEIFALHSDSIKHSGHFFSLFNDSEELLMETVAKFPYTAQFVSISHPDQTPTFFRLNHKRMLVEKFKQGSSIRSDDQWTIEPAISLNAFELLKEAFPVYPVRPILSRCNASRLTVLEPYHPLNAPNKFTGTHFSGILYNLQVENNKFLGLDPHLEMLDNPFYLSPRALSELLGRNYADR